MQKAAQEKEPPRVDRKNEDSRQQCSCKWYPTKRCLIIKSITKSVKFRFNKNLQCNPAVYSKHFNKWELFHTNESLVLASTYQFFHCNKLFVGQLTMSSLQQCMQPNVSLIMNTENIQLVYALQRTECICSLIHSTNPLPPIPSASDSASKQNAYQLAVFFRTIKQMKLKIERHKIAA